MLRIPVREDKFENKASVLEGGPTIDQHTHRTVMLARSLVQRSYVYPHVRQQCSKLTSAGSSIAAALGQSCYAQQVRIRCGDVAELDANVADKCNDCLLF